MYTGLSLELLYCMTSFLLSTMSCIVFYRSLRPLEQLCPSIPENCVANENEQKYKLEHFCKDKHQVTFCQFFFFLIIQIVNFV